MAARNDNGVVYLTRERFRELERELHELKTKGRTEMAHKIADARSYGDLSENAEYDAAKEAQGHLELRISKLEQTLSRARIIQESDLPNDKIYILSNVVLKNLKSGEEVTYKMVSAEEADFELGKLAITSPIGKALMGKKEGEEVKVNVPAGVFEYKIVKVSH
ncbi:MAG: transcription elongation factor GreA [Ignavibacteriales bacterium CG07_land_8_20_14_0_80_59_12]|nr:MAG: transcription elongation factor GreA [Ignavibacteriales bacterium CG07_land_8_20_14_0_80_59_12]